MDQGFNDQELSDIMKEIEALEDDFAVPKSSSEPTLSIEHAEALEDIDEMREDEIEDEIEDQVEDEVNVDPTLASTINILPLTSSPLHAPLSKTSTSMSFKVQGQLSIDLKFEIGEKVICLEVSESGLLIEIEGGIKFTVPVSNKSDHKKAV